MNQHFVKEGIPHESVVRPIGMTGDTLLYFVREIGAGLITEGIETEAEAEHLHVLGISKSQGYLLGRPLEVADALALAARGSRAA